MTSRTDGCKEPYYCYVRSKNGRAAVSFKIYEEMDCVVYFWTILAPGKDVFSKMGAREQLDLERSERLKAFALNKSEYANPEDAKWLLGSGSHVHLKVIRHFMMNMDEKHKPWVKGVLRSFLKRHNKKEKHWSTKFLREGKELFEDVTDEMVVKVNKIDPFDGYEPSYETSSGMWDHKGDW